MNLLSPLGAACALCVIIFASAAPAAPTSIDWPDTPAARCAKARFQAQNAPGDDAMRAYLLRYRSPVSLEKTSLEDRLKKFHSFRDQIGLLEVGEVRDQGKLAIDVIAKSKSLSIWLKFHFELEEQAPHYLRQMEARPTNPPSETVGEYDPRTKLRDLAEQVRKDMKAPALAVAVVRGGKIVEKAAVGIREYGRNDPVRIDDRFHIGSVTKSFTSTMIGKLVEDRLLSWDTTIGQALPDVDMQDEYRAVTLEQILHHRGGIPPIPESDEFDTSTIKDWQAKRQRGRQLLLERVLSEKPAVTPGTTMVYSNAGYVVAASMAERASGRTWEDLIRSTVFKPLGMTTAGFGWPATKEQPDQPRGHFGAPPDVRVQKIGQHGLGDFDIGTYCAPAGDVSCSIEDLARFASFHLRGLHGQDGVLKAKTIQRLHTPSASDTGKKRYASGWGLSETDSGEPIHWHNGSAGTFFALVFIYPESNLAVAIATNAGIRASAYVEKMADVIWQHRKDSKTDARLTGK